MVEAFKAVSKSLSILPVSGPVALFSEEALLDLVITLAYPPGGIYWYERCGLFSSRVSIEMSLTCLLLKEFSCATLQLIENFLENPHICIHAFDLMCQIALQTQTV